MFESLRCIDSVAALVSPKVFPSYASVPLDTCDHYESVTSVEPPVEKRYRRNEWKVRPRHLVQPHAVRYPESLPWSPR